MKNGLMNKEKVENLGFNEVNSFETEVHVITIIVKFVKNFSGWLINEVSYAIWSNDQIMLKF